MPRTTTRQSITLVGRASELAFVEFETGATRASFILTIKAHGNRPELVVACEGYGMKVREQFELMDEGSLVGIIGTLTKRNEGAHALVSIDRLEYLGQPLAAA
jgi:hypothetical protein